MSRYLGEPDYRHGSAARSGILLCNLGTPTAATASALRRYLGEFLWDPRVVEVRRPLWWMILNLVILNIRPARSARAYQKVWTPDGSPLLAISRRQHEALTRAVETRLGTPVPVELAMRYGEPSIPRGLRHLRDAGARRILVFPLYPQYSASTTASVFDAVTDECKRWRWIPELRFVNQYHEDAGYIEALAHRIRDHWAHQGKGQRLLFSFHGLPKRYLLEGDPYHCQCHVTARRVAEALELEEEAWQLGFQSRFGREEWLQPYTDHLLAELPKQGIKSVDVVCPGFTADCLETLEEIAMQNREIFLGGGGERYQYVPALNDTPQHIRSLARIATGHMQGWPETDTRVFPPATEEARRDSRRRALALGARQ